MGQWESKYRADEGKTWQQILQQYYVNSTLQSLVAAPSGTAYVDYSAWGNNGNVTQRVTGFANWSHTVNGLLGHNRIHFLAYDSRGQRNSDNDKYFIDLYVDTEKPVTNPALSGTAGNNGWYRSAVQVTLNARDQGSGDGGSVHNIPNHYAAGVERVHYRVNSGAWQQHTGPQVTFPVSGDGAHTVEYYAIDRVGNQETAKSFQVKIDATPPSASGAIVERNGAVSGAWQRNIDAPAFTWAAATDSGSGVAGYFIEWPTWSGLVTTPAFNPPAARTGSYPLRVQAIDRAGNRSASVTLFTFNYDGTPPPAPALQNLDGVASGVWQNQVRAANFTWPTPVDAGSGVKGYYRYWGVDEYGTSDTFSTANTFVSPMPFCAADDACTYYLRVRSEDHVGWQSAQWATFMLRYDGAPPTAHLVANYAMPVVHQTQIHLAVTASDLGSGVTQMRLSNSGYTWSEWRPLATELYWEIPAVGRRSHDIYLQVVDAAGNLSRIVSDTVLFDVNAPYPKSESFELWQSLTPAGAGIVSDTLRTMRVTVGQPSAAIAVQSAHFLLNPGFQAAALAIPTQTVTFTSYTQVGSLFASAATTATALSSAQRRLYGSLGQPSNMRTVTSANFTAELGFWAGAARDVTPPPPPPPEPPVPPECEFYSLSINKGALFTRVPQVTLNMCGPDPAQMMLSNDGGFAGAIWQPYTTALSWTLTTYGNTIIPRFVYARYKDSQGHIHGNFMDDIIYDPSAPLVVAAFDPLELPVGGVTRQTRGAYILQQAVRPAYVVNTAQAELFLSASDDSSGLAAMQVSTRPDFAGATWESFTAIVPVAFTEDGAHTVYVRTRDEAGNISTAFGQQVIVDTTPPAIPVAGTLRVLEEVVGPGTLTVTLAMSVTDDVSGVEAARVSHTPAFTDTLWITYSSHLTVPIQPTYTFTDPLIIPAHTIETLYVQLRDAVGNVSDIYTTTYLVDWEPPYGAIEVAGQSGTVITMTLSAEDNLSPVTHLWLSPDFWFFENVSRVAYQETLVWDMLDYAELYVKFEDAAGNVSWPYWTPLEISVPPEDDYHIYLPLVLRDH